MTDIIEWEPKNVYAVPAKISFPGYSAYLAMAQSVADYIDSVEVNEETVNNAKKDLAAARKVVKGLDRQRIDMKKSLMTEFDTFEKQVKEITAVVDEADKRLSAKITALDEIERDKKKDALREIWNKRVWSYKLNDLLDDAFERWMQPKYLNKTCPISTAEHEMVEWMNNVDECIETTSEISDILLNEYLALLDLPAAIRSYNQWCLRNDAIKAAKDDEDEVKAEFEVTGEKDITLTEMLLKTNNINYIKK